jgi:curli biogenesis system outer membrane secretion channel CsgG
MNTRMFRTVLAAVVSLVLCQAPAMGIKNPFKKDEPKAIEKTEKAGAGNLRYSVSVANADRAYVWGAYNVAEAFQVMLTDALQTSGHFIVLGDSQMRGEAMKEQDLVASGRTAKGKKAPKIGRLTPAQLLVKGAVTHVQNDTSGKKGRFNIKGISIGGSRGQAEINITMYIMDSETGQVKASQKIVGVSGKKGFSFGYHGSKLGGLTGDLAGFREDNVGKAAEHAVAQAVEFLVAQLEGIPWEGSILLVKGAKIIINRGSREGVEVGDRFVVGTIEELVDEDTGEVLDVEMTEVGRLQVTKVVEKIAYCKSLSGGDALAKGMTIHPADGQ